METTIITKANETLVKMTANMKLAKDLRKENISIIIKEANSFANENKNIFTEGKKGAVQAFINNTLKDKEIDVYTKRAVKIAKFIAIDGYKLRREYLTIAQMEQLCCFNKAQVNALFNFEDEEEYIEAVKELINKAKIEKKTKVFSASKARKS